METGVVKNLNIQRGFGFISRDSGGADVFFHATAMDDRLPFDETLQERRVRFDVVESPRGVKAINVCAWG